MTFAGYVAPTLIERANHAPLLLAILLPVSDTKTVLQNASCKDVRDLHSCTKGAKRSAISAPMATDSAYNPFKWLLTMLIE